MQNFVFPDIEPLKISRYSKILSTGVALPNNVVTNQNIIDKYNIIATDRAVEYALGIKERRWTGLNEKVEDLMATAINQCLERANVGIESIDRIVFTKLAGDYHVPANSIGALRKLGTKKGIPAFDIFAACSGFVHAMDLAIRYIASGDDYVLILGGSAMGKCTHYWNMPDPKTVFLFGDAIAAMLIGYSDVQHFFSSYIITNHFLYDNALIRYGTSYKNSGENVDSSIFFMKIADGNLVFQSSAQYAKVVSDKLLSDFGGSIDDIDHFVTSDQSTRIWEAQLKEIGIPKEKSTSLFYKHGNTVAAMSPLNLNHLIESGRLKRGDLVMMQAHGAGASSGGMIFKY